MAFLLGFNRPDPMDAPMLARLAEVGLQPGAPWTTGPGTDRELAQDALAGMGDALEDFHRQGSAPAKNAVRVRPITWGTREMLGTDYRSRAWGAFQGVFGNTLDQAAYGGVYLDGDGEPLDTSKHDYTLTLSRDDLAQATVFWSLTMNSLPRPYLVPNPINRYHLSSRSHGLRYDPDGSVTIYPQRQRPGSDHESNWLPAPDGHCLPAMRIYGPSEKVQRGHWDMPSPQATPLSALGHPALAGLGRWRLDRLRLRDADSCRGHSMCHSTGHHSAYQEHTGWTIHLT